jgi:cellobiose-specific phosphotransferase system component IIC
VQYYSGGWKAFGTTGNDGTVSMALPPSTYNFQITYAGASQQKSQNVATNPTVVFQTTLVTMKLLAHDGVTVLSGGAQYYAGAWKMFGVGTTTATMELLPLTYTFKISYAGASLQKSQNVATNPTVVFQTTLVTMKLLSSTGQELSGGAQYYASAWKTFGAGTTTTTMELLPLTYSFQVTYAGSSQQKSQNVASAPSVVFQTTLVTVKLLSSTGGELSGGIQYNAGGWKTFGGGTTTTTMELLPLTYTFKISYGGASQQKSQNVATNANVIFQTVQVHSDSGKCTSYLAGSWRTFSQDMELLPGTYTFRFSDGTVNTSYTLVAGAVKHIH